MSHESAIAMINGQAQVPPPVDPGAERIATPQELESTRMAHLAKKESERVKKEMAFKQERDAFQKERDELLAYKKRITEFEETKQKDSVAAMKLAGFTDTDILNYYASLEDKSTPEEKAAKAAQAEINKFKEEQAKKEAEVNGKRNAEAINNYKNNMHIEIVTDAEKYPYANFYGPIAEELAYATVEEDFKLGIKDDPNYKPLSVKEAVQIVEQYYKEQDEAMEKIRKKPVAEAIEEAKEKIEQLKPEVSPGMGKPTKTLSSKATATAAAAIPNKQETPSQKRERLIEKLRNIGK